MRGQVVLLSESADAPPPALLPFASSAKELFEVAQREARWLEHGRIDTWHLVLAVVREDEGEAARVLAELGIARDSLRAQALAALGADWAIELSPAEEVLSHKEQWLREAEAHHRAATTDKQRRERQIDVEIFQSIVDDARAEVIPQSCQDALTTLAGFATEQWLERQPKPPPEEADRRRWYRDHCTTNIHAQLVRVLFHPALGSDAVETRRGDVPEVIPKSWQNALNVLSEFAAEDWLQRHPPGDEADRRVSDRDHCAVDAGKVAVAGKVVANIRAQMSEVLLDPALGPEANPILGHPGGPESPEAPGRDIPFTLPS